MQYSNFIYNTNGNSIINEKMNRVKDFSNALSSLENNNWHLEDSRVKSFDKIINTCENPNDYSSLIVLIPKPDNCGCRKFTSMLLLLNILALRLANNYTESDKPAYETLYHKFKQFENCMVNESIDKYDEIYINNIGNIIQTIDRVNTGSPTIDYPFYVSPSTLHSVSRTVNEVSQFIDDDACNRDNTNKINSHIMNLINETNLDYFISKMDEIYKFMISCDGTFTDSRCNVITISLGKALDMVINDITGKEKLLDVISQCDELLSKYTDSEYQENIDALIDYMEDITNAISENMTGETSSIHEMGLGYIYDIIPEDDSVLIENIDEIVSSLNEAADKFDMISVLNESIKENVKNKMNKYKETRKIHKEKDDRFKEKRRDEPERLFDATADTRVDLDDKRQRDEYDRKESTRQVKTNVKNQNIDDKYNLKNQKRQSKIDLKYQKKIDRWDQKKNAKSQKTQNDIDYKQGKRQDKWEQKKDKEQRKLDDKEAKHQKRLEDRQRRRDETKIGLNRWKTLELTNANVRKASNAVRKASNCVAAYGVGALTGINPILTGSTYLMSSYIKDKNNPIESRRKWVDDIRTQITDIDEKISQAESNGEADKKRALMKMRQRLNSTLTRLNKYNLFDDDSLS